ncbi:MAG: hypothetical protein NVS3B20_23100 [Polyangiales bacterium]
MRGPCSEDARGDGSTGRRRTDEGTTSHVVRIVDAFGIARAQTYQRTFVVRDTVPVVMLRHGINPPPKGAITGRQWYQIDLELAHRSPEGGATRLWQPTKNRPVSTLTSEEDLQNKNKKG